MILAPYKMFGTVASVGMPIVRVVSSILMQLVIQQNYCVVPTSDSVTDLESNITEFCTRFAGVSGTNETTGNEVKRVPISFI